MSQFSTTGSGQVSGVSVETGNFVLHMDSGLKGLIRGAAHEIDLSFQKLFLTSEVGELSIRSESDLLLAANSTGTGDIHLDTSLNGDIFVKRNGALLGAFLNDAYLNSLSGPGSGFSSFIFGGDDETSLTDLQGSYLDNSANKEIHFSIGSPSTAKNFYVGGDAEIKGHLELVSTSAYNDQAHFKNGVLIDTAGTLDVDRPSDFSDQVTVSLTSTPTNATDGALVVAGGISIDANGSTGNAIFAAGDVVIEGNLSVSGTNTIVETTTLSVQDPIIELARTANNVALTVATTYDIGVRGRYHDGAEKDLFFGVDTSEGKFVFYSTIDDAEAAGPTVASGVFGNVKFGEIHTNQLSGGSIPFYSANGLDEFQVTSGAGTASLISADISGGVGGAFVEIASELNATSTTTGALQIAGGLGVAKDLYADNIFASSALQAGNLTADRLALTSTNGQLITDDMFQIDLAAMSLSILDSGAGASMYAKFEGSNRRFVAESIQIPGNTVAGGVAFTDANGIFQEDANIVWDASDLDITGGAKLTSDIDLDAATTDQKITKSANDVNDLIIERKSDQTASKIRIIAQNSTDTAGSATPSIEIKAMKDPLNSTNMLNAAIGTILIESEKEDNAGSVLNLVAPSGGIQLSSGTSVEITSGGTGSDAVQVDNLLVSVDPITNMIQGPANSQSSLLSVGNFNTSQLVMTLFDKYSGESGTVTAFLQDSLAAEVIKPLAKTAWGLSLTPVASNDPLSVFDLTVSRSDGILHSKLTAIGGGVVEQPELFFNGEKIVGWNGSAYSVAGASLQAVYDESSSLASLPMIQIANAAATDPLEIRVGAGVNGEFQLTAGSNATDAILRASDNGIRLGQANLLVSFDGFVDTDILFHETSNGNLGYDSVASAGTKSVTINGHNSSGAQSGDIVLSAGAGPAGAVAQRGDMVFEQHDEAHMVLRTGVVVSGASAIDRGMVVGCDGSIINPTSSGGTSNYRGVLGINVPRAGGFSSNVGDELYVAMNGTIALVQEVTSGGTGNISDANGVGVPALPGSRIFLSDQQQGKVALNSPNSAGDRVVQMGYLIDGTSITINGNSYVKIMVQTLDEGEIF